MPRYFKMISEQSGHGFLLTGGVTCFHSPLSPLYNYCTLSQGKGIANQYPVVLEKGFSLTNLFLNISYIGKWFILLAPFFYNNEARYPCIQMFMAQKYATQDFLTYFNTKRFFYINKMPPLMGFPSIPPLPGM